MMRMLLDIITIIMIHYSSGRYLISDIYILNQESHISRIGHFCVTYCLSRKVSRHGRGIKLLNTIFFFYLKRSCVNVKVMRMFLYFFLPHCFPATNFEILLLRPSKQTWSPTLKMSWKG